MVHVEKRVKTLRKSKFVQLINLKLFHAYEKIPIKAFSTLDEYKNTLNLNGLKYKLNSVNTADFSKQASSIQESRKYKTSTKPSSGRSNQIMTSDSDYTSHICFLFSSANV